jgi:hypothetical protein
LNNIGRLVEVFRLTQSHPAGAAARADGGGARL